MSKWIIKTDPETYSISDFEKERVTVWDGVRNYQARNYLQEMNRNDLLLVYHSNIDRAIVGLASVESEAFPDPTTEDIRWKALKIKFLKKFDKTLTLDAIKKNEALKDILLVKQTRLSVMPIIETEYNEIIKH